MKPACGKTFASEVSHARHLLPWPAHLHMAVGYGEGSAMIQSMGSRHHQVHRPVPRLSSMGEALCFLVGVVRLDIQQT